MTVNGRPLLGGDSVGLHQMAKLGQKKGGDWYDLLSNDIMQFRAQQGDIIGLEVRPIPMWQRNETDK